VENAQGPPNLLWRVAAAMMYLIPWIDTIHIGREIYHRFPITVIIDRLPGAQRGPRSPTYEAALGSKCQIVAAGSADHAENLRAVLVRTQDCSDC